MINVDNVAPEVEITGEYVEVASPITLSVRVTDVAGDLPSSEGSGATVEWDMGDGAMLNGPSVSHSFMQEGTFTVCSLL